MVFVSTWKETIDSLVQSLYIFTNLPFKLEGCVWTFQLLVGIKITVTVHCSGCAHCHALPNSWHLPPSSIAESSPLWLLMMTVASLPGCTLTLEDQKILQITDCRKKKSKIQNPFKESSLYTMTIAQNSVPRLHQQICGVSDGVFALFVILYIRCVDDLKKQKQKTTNQTKLAVNCKLAA